MSNADTSKGIVVHHLEDSRSQRILWLLEELEIPYTIKFYKRHPETKQAPPELLEVHPLGKSPVITDGSLTLAETGAIVEYLINRYGKDKCRIADEKSQAPHVPLDHPDLSPDTHFAEGSVLGPLTFRIVGQIVPSKVPFIIRPIVRFAFDKIDDLSNGPDLERQGKLVEAHLMEVESRGGWFAGTGEDRPTSADFVMALTLQILVVYASDYRGPKTREYIKKVQARPAYKRALEKGGEGFAFEYKD